MKKGLEIENFYVNVTFKAIVRVRALLTFFILLTHEGHIGSGGGAARVYNPA